MINLEGNVDKSVINIGGKVNIKNSFNTKETNNFNELKDLLQNLSNKIFSDESLKINERKDLYDELNGILTI